MKATNSQELNRKLTGLRNKVHDFLAMHRTEATQVASSLPHVFEAICYVLVLRYFESDGYRVEARRLIDGKFRFKYNTNGDPWNYSYFVVLRQDPATNICVPIAEVWHNQLVAGSWCKAIDLDGEVPLFAADVAVVRPNSVPTEDRPKRRKGIPQPKPRTWVRNEDLLTFGEAKCLVAYPMLLAQFFGIVHEIKPAFLEDRASNDEAPLLYPILFTDNILTKGAKKVILSFVNRGLTISVVPNVSLAKEEELIELMRKGICGFVIDDPPISRKSPINDRTKAETVIKSEDQFFADLGL